MTMFRITAAALLLSTTAAFAQTTAPATPAASPPAATAPATPAPAATVGLTKDGKPKMDDVRAQCRDEVRSGGAKGDARKQAMADCIIKKRPDMETRVKCQMDPAMKGLDKDARRAAMKACVTKAKS